MGHCYLTDISPRTTGTTPVTTPGTTTEKSLSPSFDSPSLLTPQSQTSGSSFSRSSSTLSAASIATLGLGDGESQVQDEHGIDFQASGEGEDNDEDANDDGSDDGGYDMMKQHSRGRRVFYSLEDRTMVTSPILTLLDSSLLAPVSSELFIEKLKQKNGSAKKHAVLDFDAFKAMIKHIIRELAVECSGQNVHQRLFWAAYDVVRKRRANHVQSWRLLGHPKELIYGGKASFIQKHGNVWATSKNAKKKKREEGDALRKSNRQRFQDLRQALINCYIFGLSDYLSSIPIIHLYYTFI